MNRRSLNILLLITAGCLSGCIATPQQMRTERDLDELKRRLANIELNTVSMQQDRQGQVRERLETMNLSQADLKADLENMRVEVQALNGRLEDVVRQMESVRGNVSLSGQDLGLKQAALEDRLARLEEQLKGMPATTAPAAGAQGGGSADELYRRGLDLIQGKGDFIAGRGVLDQFLKSYPDDPLAVNAMYWVGEAYYGEGKYENAILQFQDVIQKYGEHPKVASALLKQGMAFQAMKDVSSGKVILKKLIDTFPLSPEAKRAKELLATWK